jgi:Retron-type reverse transcriptase
MTDMATYTGAFSDTQVTWSTIKWNKVYRNVRRLQVRIVKATQAKRWGKVKALQRLLTRSFSAKVLAIRRVTENKGQKTPGVDGEVWNTPEKKSQAINKLKQYGYQPSPLKRVYIPKAKGRRGPSRSPRCWTGPCRLSISKSWIRLLNAKQIRTLMGSDQNDQLLMQ